MNISEIAKKLGGLGGKKTKEKYGREHFVELRKIPRKKKPLTSGRQCDNIKKEGEVEMERN